MSIFENPVTVTWRNKGETLTIMTLKRSLTPEVSKEVVEPSQDGIVLEPNVEIELASPDAPELNE